jgi:hypothetical protein
MSIDSDIDYLKHINQHDHNRKTDNNNHDQHGHHYIIDHNNDHNRATLHRLMHVAVAGRTSEMD